MIKAVDKRYLHSEAVRILQNGSVLIETDKGSFEFSHNDFITQDRKSVV